MGNDDFAFRFQYADGSAFEIFADGRAELVFKDGRRESPKGVIVNRIPRLIDNAVKEERDAHECPGQDW